MRSPTTTGNSFFELRILCVGDVRPKNVLYLVPIFVMSEILLFQVLILLEPEILSAVNLILRPYKDLHSSAKKSRKYRGVVCMLCM